LLLSALVPIPTSIIGSAANLVIASAIRLVIDVFVLGFIIAFCYIASAIIASTITTSIAASIMFLFLLAIVWTPCLKLLNDRALLPAVSFFPVS
jgi:hypothetical protein